MTQMLLPLYSDEVSLLTPSLGVKKECGEVVYYHSGAPMYSHKPEELHKFRFITSNFLLQGLCKGTDIQRVFHVSTDSIRRWKKVLSEQGEDGFFRGDNRKGRSHKLVPEVLSEIQKELDKGSSVNSIAKAHGLSEGSIRYSIKLGRLKKKNQG